MPFPTCVCTKPSSSMPQVTLTHKSSCYGTSLPRCKQYRRQKPQPPSLRNTCVPSTRLSATSLKPFDKWWMSLVDTPVVHCLNLLAHVCGHSSSACRVVGQRPRVRTPTTLAMDLTELTVVQTAAPIEWICAELQTSLRIATAQVKQDPRRAHVHLLVQHHLATRGRTHDKQAHRRVPHRGWSPRRWITQTKPHSAS